MTPSTPLAISPLARVHDRAAFSCGVEALDSYLRTQAGQDQRRRVARVFVCCEQGSEAVLGYYTLSSLSIALSGLPEDKARRLPRHPVPAALIGRLAVSEGVQGQGIGRLLLADAVKRSLAVSEEIAIYALVVDAKDERASRFYRSFGFKPLVGQRSRLFLPLGSVLPGLRPPGAGPAPPARR